MVEAADAKNFHPRLTNLGTCDFGVALALPEIPATELIGVDKRREPKVHESLLERLSNILQRTDVSYLCVKFPYLTCARVRFLKFALTSVLNNTDYPTYRSSTLQLTTKPPRKSGLRDGLTLKCPDIFDVTCKSCISPLVQGLRTHECIILWLPFTTASQLIDLRERQIHRGSKLALKSRR